MSKKRTRDVSNNTTEVEMQLNNINSLPKYEHTKLQNIAPVCIPYTQFLYLNILYRYLKKKLFMYT